MLAELRTLGAADVAAVDAASAAGAPAPRQLLLPAAAPLVEAFAAAHASRQLALGDRRVARQQLLAAGKGKHDEAAAAEEESSGGDVQADFCFFAELLDLALTWLARVAPPALGTLGAAAADDGGDAHGGSAPAALATVAALLRAASRASVYRARRDAAGVQWKVIDRAVDLAVPLARAACDAPASAAAAPAVRRACADVLHALLLLESRAFRPHAPLALELAAMATPADGAATDENDPLVALPLALLSVAAAERQMPATLEHLAARAAAPGGLGALQGLAPLWHSLARLVSVVPEAQAPELLPEVLDALERASAALPGAPRSAEACRASFWQLSCLASLVADSAPIVEPTAPAMRSIATRLASVVTSFAPPRHAPGELLLWRSAEALESQCDELLKPGWPAPRPAVHPAAIDFAVNLLTRPDADAAAPILEYAACAACAFEAERLEEHLQLTTMLSDWPPPQEPDDEAPPPLDADEARERLRDLVSALLAWEEADVRTAIASGARWPLLPSAIDAHPRRRSMSTVARWQLVSGGGLCRIIDAHATEKQRLRWASVLWQSLCTRTATGAAAAAAPPPPGVTSVSLRSLATGALNAASLYELRALHASLVPAAWRWMLRRLPDAASLGRRAAARVRFLVGDAAAATATTPMTTLGRSS